MMNTASENKSAAVRVVFAAGNDISTDSIYPGRFMATVLPSETPQFAFADFTEFNARLRKGEITPGSVIIAGTNFGCGSSREQAASALKGYSLTLVAKSFARIFLQNAINLGLHTVICPRLDAQEGDEIRISHDLVTNLRTGNSFAIQALPAARQAILAAGGLIAYTRQRLLQRG